MRKRKDKERIYPNRKCDNCGKEYQPTFSQVWHKDCKSYCSPQCRKDGRIFSIFNYKNMRERLENLSVPEPMSGCVIWISCKDKYGYGYLGGKGWKKAKAHRISYEIAKGKIPDGLVIDHLCRNPACINPDHLEAVSQAVNVDRGLSGKKQFCKRGHPLSGDNLFYRKNPNRNKTGECRSCYASRKLERKIRMAS